MARILTRNWFWILATTVVPLLWQVLVAAPQDEAAGQAATARELKAAHDICKRLDMAGC